MSQEPLSQSSIKTIQFTTDELHPSIIIASPEKMINRIIQENTTTTPTKQRSLIKKRLKKRSQLIIEKKIAKNISTRYFDKEAELGSDNEEHDDIIKDIKGSDNDEDDDDENNKNIENLINDTDIINDDINQKEKFIEDELILDKERIKKVIEGPQERQLNKKRKREFEEDINDLPLQVRIEKMNNDNQQDDKESEFKTLIFNYKKLQHDINEDDGENEEMKSYFQSYQASTIRKLNIMSGQHNKELKERIKEDNAILQNVIMKNKQNLKEKTVNKPKLSSVPMKAFGSYMNKTNSFLVNLKKDNEMKQQEKTLEPNKDFERGSFLSKTNGLFGNNYKVDSSTLTVRGGCLLSLFVKKKQ